MFEKFSRKCIYYFNLVKGAARFQKNRVSDSVIDKQTVIGGNHSIFNVKISLGTYVSTNCYITNTVIGKFCSIGPNFLCGFGIHPTNGISTSPVFYSTKKQSGFTYCTKDKIQERKDVFIGNDVFIGANVTVLDGVKIGDGAIIGAGSVVSKNIPPYAVAVGAPISIIKYRFEQDKIDYLLKAKWWDQGPETFKQVEEHFFDLEAFMKVNDLKNNIS